MEQHNPPHPGEILKRTYFDKDPKMTVSHFSNETSLGEEFVDSLLNGLEDIDVEVAKRISFVLGGTAESWLALQDAYNFKNLST